MSEAYPSMQTSPIIGDDIADQLTERAEEFARSLYPDATKDGNAIILDSQTKLFIGGIKAGQCRQNGNQIDLLTLAQYAKGTNAAGLIHARRFLGLSQAPDDVPILTVYQEPDFTPRQPARRNGYLQEMDRILPSSSDAEKGVLSSILRDPSTVIPLCLKRITPAHFHFPGHAMIYEEAIAIFAKAIPVELITVTQELINHGKLDQCGGPAYVTELFDFVPTAANVEYYLDIVREKFFARSVILACEAARLKAYDDSGEIDTVFEGLKFDITKIETGKDDDVENFNFGDLLNFDSKNDPDNLIGHRWICKGHTVLWAGGAGFGKSTWIMQASIYWAMGLSVCGMKPVRELKSLIIQAENDKGDTAEQFQGVLFGIESSDMAFGNGVSQDDMAGKMKDNVIIKRVISATGAKFCSILESLIKEYKPDLVWIDPLFSFAGIDLCDTPGVSAFLRGSLMPIANRHGCAINVVHHIGKPDKDGAAKAGWSDLDFQYLGFGSSEMMNSFRSVNIILPVSGAEKSFRMILSKRGNRAGALSLDEDCSMCNGSHRLDNGEDCPRCDGTGRERTTNIYLAHSQQGIYWKQISKPEVVEPNEKNGKKKFKDAITVDEILEWFSTTQPMTSTEICNHCVNNGLCSKPTFWRYWAELKKDPRIIKRDHGWIKAGGGDEIPD